MIFTKIVYGVLVLSILSISVWVVTLSIDDMGLNRDTRQPPIGLHNDTVQDPVQMEGLQTGHPHALVLHNDTVQDAVQMEGLQTGHPHTLVLHNDTEQDPLQIKDLQTHCYQPKDDTKFDCEHMHKDYACFVQDLWMINGEFYLNFSRGTNVPWTSAYNSFSIPNAHAQSIQINNLQNLDFAHINASLITHHTNGLHVFHNRIYPRNFGHALRDTLPIDVVLFHHFFSDTWDPDLISSNLHVYYMDGDTSSLLNVYRTHTNASILTNNFKTPSVHRYSHAVLGHLVNTPNPIHNCFNHRSWFNFSIFMAQRVLNHIPQRKQQQVWILNRPSGDEREWINEHDLITQLVLHVNITIVTKLPRDASFSELVQLARESSVFVGPHGSNLAAIIMAGSAGTLVEVQSRGCLRTWWANQCRYQGSRWFSAHDSFNIPDTGSSRALCDIQKTIFIILKAIQNPDYQPACMHQSDEFRICR